MDPDHIPHDFNAAEYFVDRHVHEGRGAKTALEYIRELDGEIEHVTYAELHANVNRCGNALCILGVRREERVALLLLDSPAFAYAFFGAIKMGAVAVPMNTMLRPHEWEQLLNDCRARVLVISEQLRERFREIDPTKLKYIESIVVVHVAEQPTLAKDGLGRGTHAVSDFESLLANASPELAPEPLTRDDAAFWLYSSGSTGAPKGCVHLQHDMVVAAERYAIATLGIREDDRCFSVAKLFFAYGLGNALYFPLAVGATTILWPGTGAPANVFHVIEHTRPTLFFSVPTNYAALVAHSRGADALVRAVPQGGTPPAADFDLSSIRWAVSAGEALPAALYENFRARFSVDILDAIGSTECAHMFIANRPGAVRPGSSGQLIEGFGARLLDDAGKEVPPGEIGNLCIRSDATCVAYWNQHEKTKQTIVGEWIRTGDKYHVDTDGYYWYDGRSDDMMKVSGAWVSPIEIEARLMEHATVLEAAVIGREDENRLLRAAAFVVLKDGNVACEALASELIEFVHARLAGIKCPKWVEFVDALPKTATGKIQRYRLREKYRSD